MPCEYFFLIPYLGVEALPEKRKLRQALFLPYPGSPLFPFRDTENVVRGPFRTSGLNLHLGQK